MKAIMYHYVRPDSPEFPFFRHLHIDDFVKQIEWLGNEYGYVSKEEFNASFSSPELAVALPESAVVLTFDDGFKDHYSYVLPELLKRGLWGIFYIPTSPLASGSLIDVHCIHLLLGKYGGTEIMGTLRKILTEDMLSHAHVDEFRTETYSGQSNGMADIQVKRLLNYFIDYKFRPKVISDLMRAYFPQENELVDSFYMTKQELAQMCYSGMVLGSHTVTHPVMSKLTIKEQSKEILSSFHLIESIVGKQEIKTFCYPYGGFHTFTAETEDLLEKNSCLFSFNVEPRDITQNDLTSRRQALPRFDCNLFPYGSCRQI